MDQLKRNSLQIQHFRQSDGLTYRADVDGLRAVAVVAVLLYHAELLSFSGGFIGVDVFFVISGFIIARGLLAEIQQGSFSIRHFYARRIRRIFPPLVVVILSTLIFSSLILTPSEFSKLAESGLAAIFLVPNLYFSDGAYFAATEIRPLLHTWSLGVEEQFYLLFPLMLLPLAQRIWGRKFTLALLGIVGLGSIIASFYFISQELLVEAFFLPHLRAWELLAGAAVAFVPKEFQLHPLIRRLVSLLALVVLIFLAVSYSSSTVFPGLSALPPVLCAVAIILLRPADGLASWVLTNPVSVFVGKLSYSLYLWHYPALTLAAYLPGELSIIQKVLALGAAMLLSLASWALLEVPFRRRRKSGRSTPSWVLVATSASVVAAFSTSVIQFDGFPNRFSKNELRYIGMQQKEVYFDIYDRGRCFLDYEQVAAEYDIANCQSQSDRPRILLWGDSFAAHLYPGLVGERSGVVYQYTATSCRPMVTERKRCGEFVDRLDEVLKETAPDIVIMSGFWGPRFSSLGRDEFLEDLREAIRLAQKEGAKVVVTGNSPTYEVALPHLARFEPEMWRPGVIYVRSLDYSPINLAIEDLSESEGVAFFDFFRACRELDCPAYINGEPLHWDFGHMTLTGSLFFASQLDQFIYQKFGQ